MLEDGKIISNSRLKSDYFKVTFHAPKIIKKVKQGQFVHVLIESLRDRILRRPFSIYDVNPDHGTLSIIYKILGEGTMHLARLEKNASCSLMGPLGNGFSMPKKGAYPVIVAGGYGVAATHILAKKIGHGTALIGAKNQDELILVEEMEKNGFKTIVSTDDGSCGKKGFVTDLLEEMIFTRKPEKSYAFYACGPHPMLIKLAQILTKKHMDGELSLDHVMCCGVGACFACVEKIKDKNSPDGWRYARTCKEGPVFNASELFLE